MTDRGLRVTVDEYLILTTGACRVHTDITQTVTTLTITGRRNPFGRNTPEPNRSGT